MVGEKIEWFNKSEVPLTRLTRIIEMEEEFKEQVKEHFNDKSALSFKPYMYVVVCF